MNPSPTAVLWLGRIYFAVSVVLWPLTTIISTAFAIKLKIPRPAQRRPLPLQTRTTEG
jgi:hypothetical protein